MDKKEAIDYLRERSEEIPALAKMRYNNNNYPLWIETIRGVVANIFGQESSEYQKLATRYKISGSSEEARQNSYKKILWHRQIDILSIIQMHETLGTTSVTKEYLQPPKAFIAHGGESPALDKLKRFLDALGVEPLVVEEQPSEGRSIAENVDYYASQSDLAIILATKGDIDGKTGSFIPRGNVLMEIGKSQGIFKEKIIYLLQAGTKFPTNVSEKVWGRFTSSQMDNAFIKIAKELKKFGILKAVKP